MAISLIKYSFEIGAITEEQREKAERYKKETGASDETVIKDMKLLSEEKLIQIYSKIYGYKAELEPEVSDFTLATQFKKRDLQRLGFFPANSENAIVLYTSEPSELLFVEDFVRDKTGYDGVYFDVQCGFCKKVNAPCSDIKSDTCLHEIVSGNHCR